MLTSKQTKILNLIHELETTVGTIYELFAESFPEQSELWEGLAKEEKEHAEAVRLFYHLTYEGNAVFMEGVLRPEGVESVLEHLKMTYQKAKKGEFTAEQALFAGHDIEKGLLERDIFKHFKASQDAADTLHLLQKGCLKHVALISAEMDRIRKASRLL